jgi:hypothetical protein
MGEDAQSRRGADGLAVRRAGVGENPYGTADHGSAYADAQSV